MVRSVPEWVGRTVDAAVPPHVRLRNFRNHGGICHITGRKIGPGDDWQCDHVIAIIDGGENRERNLAPALNDALGHKGKTADEVARKARVDKRAKSHLGIKAPSKRGLPGRSRDEREADRQARGGSKIAVPKPRSLFGDAR